MLWAGPLASSSHPAPAVLTDDCRGQAGCLGAGLRAGFPARQGLWGPCVLGALPTLLHPLPRASAWAGAGTRLTAVPGCTLGAHRLGSIRVPDMVLPGGEARTLLWGGQAQTQGGLPITEGLLGRGICTEHWRMSRDVDTAPCVSRCFGFLTCMGAGGAGAGVW